MTKISYRKARALNPAFNPCSCQSNPWDTDFPKMTDADWKRLEAHNALVLVESTLSGSDGRFEVTERHAQAALNHLDEIEKKLGKTPAPDLRRKIASYRKEAQRLIRGGGAKKKSTRKRNAGIGVGHRIGNLARRLANGGLR